MQSQAALLQARMQEQQQMAAETAARTGLINQQSAGLTQEDLDDSNVADAARRVAKDPTDTNAQADLISGFAKAYRKNPEGTSKSLGDLFAQFQARSGSTNFPQMGALQGGAANIADTQAKVAEEAGKPVIIPQGGAAMAPTGNIMAVAPANIPEGAVRVGETSEPPVTQIAAGTPKPAAGALPPSVLAPAFKQMLENSTGGTNVDQAVSQLEKYNAPAANPATAAPAPVAQKPTRAIAQQYVDKYGQAQALQKLQSDGFDTSGYAD